MSFIVIYKEKIIKAGRFLSWDEYLYGKYRLDYGEIPPSRGRMKSQIISFVISFIVSFQLSYKQHKVGYRNTTNFFLDASIAFTQRLYTKV